MEHIMHDTEGETIDDVRRQRDELGIQLAALRERLGLAMAVVDAARIAASAVELPAIDRALAAFDAVPGDTLERP
jgi:predicted transcriptional regulator